jgi:cytochrome bd-type quinol oxidase subunit 2
VLKKLKQSIVTLIAAAALLVPMAAPVMVYAQPAPPAAAPTGSGADVQGSLCGGVELSADSADANCNNVDATGTAKANSLIKNIINIFSLIVGVVAVIMIIFGGFRYITSGGNDSSVGSAKNTILYAVVGLVIVALAQIIVRFVLTKATA